MPKYYKMITEETTLNTRSGPDVVFPASFRRQSASIVSTCSFIQCLLQHVIYVTHGAELRAAKRTLSDFPSPKSRIDFLCSFPYSEADPVFSAVFEYARLLFRDLYEIRNILSHEVWAMSDAHGNAVIFSSLEEEARRLMVTGRIWHADDANTKEIFDGMIRYIRNVKLVDSADLKAAMVDADLCSWILMNISNVLQEQDTARREEARRLFLQFHGTAHLFGGGPSTSGTLAFSASRRKDIKG